MKNYNLKGRTQGLAGPTGPQGPPGPTNVLYGTLDPVESDGKDGDLFIKVDHTGLAVTFFGPKMLGNWGTGIKLTGESQEAGPNLIPYKITVAKSACAGIDDSPYLSSETYYVAWWIVNNGTALSTNQAPIAVYLDGQVISTNVIGELDVGSIANCCICITIGAATLTPLTVGTHAITISVDSGNNNGSYNTFQKIISVQ